MPSYNINADYAKIRHYIFRGDWIDDLHRRKNIQVIGTSECRRDKQDGLDSCEITRTCQKADDSRLNFLRLDQFTHTSKYSDQIPGKSISMREEIKFIKGRTLIRTAQITQRDANIEINIEPSQIDLNKDVSFVFRPAAILAMNQDEQNDTTWMIEQFSAFTKPE